NETSRGATTFDRHRQGANACNTTRPNRRNLGVFTRAGGDCTGFPAPGAYFPMLYVPTIFPAAMMSSSDARTGLLRISNSPVTPANFPVPPRICPFNGTVVPNGIGDAVLNPRKI